MNLKIRNTMNNQELLDSLICEVGLPRYRTFLTGSRAFGTHYNTSDYDVCVPIGYASECKLKFPLYEPSDYNNGVSFCYKENYTVNIIPLHPLDAVCWYLATQEITRLCKSGMSTRFFNTESRHGMFEMLRGFYKTAFPYNGAKDAWATLDRLMRDQAPPVIASPSDDLGDDDDIPF